MWPAGLISRHARRALAIVKRLQPFGLILNQFLPTQNFFPLRESIKYIGYVVENMTRLVLKIGRVDKLVKLKSAFDFYDNT